MSAARILRRSVRLWLSVAALLIGGCGGSDAIKPAELVQFKPNATAKVVWHASVGKADVYIFSPALVEGSVFAASASGSLVRLDGATGRQRWKVNTKQPLSGGVGADGGLVMVGTSKGAVLAYDLDGKPAWTTQVSSEVLMAPNAADGIVVVRSGDGRIVGLDAKDGKLRWEYRFTLPPLLLWSNSGVVITQGEVLAGLAGGKVVALKLTDGSLQWEATLAQAKGANELERITDIAAAPDIDGDHACAVTFQGRVGCYDLTRGSLLWSRDASSPVALTHDPITVYMTDARSTVFALDKSTGATVWKQDKLLARQASAPVQTGLFVAVGDYQGYVHFMDRDDGGFAVRVSTDGSAIKAKPQRLGSNILVQTRKGGLYVIAVKTM